ncbi:hypothetical protein SAY86_001296 [Trapa natans]|uniref:Uncharacterized protein n=1 Tax=Trapa natans TaxID=22666 RepID=A0AAN7N311_TRANT|nr:hypothetical protein SAY86_001296 [Trapa natans]
MFNRSNTSSSTNTNSNNSHHHLHDQMMGPRISFSSDFMVDSSQMGYEIGATYKEAPVSSDFEFSVMGCDPSRLTPADEIFYQGKLLPVDELGCSDQVRRMTTTLREELLVEEGGEDEPPRRSSGSGGRWMERLRLKKGRRHRGTGGKGLETVEEEVASQEPSRKQQEGIAEAGRQSFRNSRG